MHRCGDACHLDRGQRPQARRGRVRERKGLQLGNPEESDTDHDDRHHDLDETEAARADVWRQRNHVQVPGLLTCVWVVIRPTPVITRQRDQAELAVESCSVSVVPTMPAAVVANPSRLYVTALTLPSAIKVSGVEPVKAPCTRSTPAEIGRASCRERVEGRG